MVDAVATQNELESITQVIDMGQDTTVDPLAERLRQLRDAIVKDDPYHDAWAALDVRHLIEPTLIVERFRHRLAVNPWIRRLQWIRNILLFLPILYTGGMVLLALIVSMTDGEPRESFIFQWNQGFQGRLVPLLRPAAILIVDIVLLVLILALTQSILWLKGRDNRKHAREAHLLHARLVRVLGDASICLATGRWQTPTNLVARFDESASGLLQQMQEERQRLGELANRREKEFADLGAFTSGVAGVTDQMLVAANVMKDTTVRLLQELQLFADQYRSIPQQQQTVLLATNQTVQHLQESLAVIGRIEARQEQQELALTSSLAQVDAAITRIVEAAASLQTSTGEYVVQQQTFFEKMQAEREMQNKFVTRVISATENSGKALQAFDEGAKDLHIIAVDLNNMRNQLYAFLQSMKDEIFSDMKEAASHITTSSASLANAGAAIEQASQSLSQAIPFSHQETVQVSGFNNNDDDDLTRSVTSKLG